MAKMVPFLVFVLFLEGALGELVCEELPVGMCSFSIASSGKRCLLETFESDDGILEFQCKTSQVLAINFHEYIESDECVNACGVNRKWVGISSDSLLLSKFTLKLCSPQCYQNCPNIIELYYNLAVAEGEFLPELCKSQRTSERRSIIQLQSASAALGPVSALAASAPTQTASIVDCAPAPM